jgi:transcriptional regulator with XRE-family HTH domain
MPADPLVEQILLARRRAGLSQMQLAERVGRMAGNDLSDLELGKRSPTLATLRRWVGALGYDLALVPAAEPERDISPTRKDTPQ